MSGEFPALELLYSELERVATEIRAGWGSVPSVRSAFGVHGVSYVDRDDDEDGIGFATIGFVMPEGIYAEIEHGTYGELQGFRVFRESGEEDLIETLELSDHRATFSPQAWQNNYAVPVDPEGETIWVVSKQALAAWKETFIRPDSPIEEGDLYDNPAICDGFLDDPAAPEWIRSWRGPFDIYVERIGSDDDDE